MKAACGPNFVKTEIVRGVLNFPSLPIIHDREYRYTKISALGLNRNEVRCARFLDHSHFLLGKRGAHRMRVLKMVSIAESLNAIMLTSNISSNSSLQGESCR